MAITFTYTEATNTVVQTEGTSGTPATFAHFVTADRAGTDTVLLVATAGLSPTLALDYAVRPVEDLAVLVKCVVASKTTETDYIFITGTDWRGAAQTESIDVSAGNGSYTSTKYWATISNIDCSDNSAGGGTQWADGTVAVTQDIWGVIWDYGDGQYRPTAKFDIGDASTSTYFQTSNEATYCEQRIKVTVGATFIGGSQSVGSDESGFGTYLNIVGVSSTVPFCSGGVVYFYNSIIHWRDNHLTFNTGSLYLYNVVFTGAGLRAYNWVVYSNMTTVVMSDVYVYNALATSVRLAAATILGLTCEAGHIGIKPYNADSVMSDVLIRNTATYDISAQGGDQTLINPKFTVGGIQITQAGNWIKEQYSCNIKVADKDGTLLDGVEVLCEDEGDATVWTTTTGDTDTGEIDEQIVTYKKWTGTSETLTTLSPHKFTISKAGYETPDPIIHTVDGPINWVIVLEAQKQPVAPWQEGMM